MTTITLHQQHVDEIIKSLGIMEAQCMGDATTESWASTHTEFVLRALSNWSGSIDEWMDEVDRQKWVAVDRQHAEDERIYRESITNPEEEVSP